MALRFSPPSFFLFKNMIKVSGLVGEEETTAHFAGIHTYLGGLNYSREPFVLRKITMPGDNPTWHPSEWTVAKGMNLALRIRAAEVALN